MIRNYLGSMPISVYVKGSSRSTFKLPESFNVTLTINPNPEDATVIINGEERNTISVTKGETVTYSVSKEGYTTISETVVVNENVTLNIELEEEGSTDYTYTLSDNNALLTKYIGTDKIVVVPHKVKGE